jgi:rubrerythrin
MDCRCERNAVSARESGPTMEWVFTEAIRFELRVRQFYIALAAGSAAYPPGAELWRQMAADEQHHADTLKRLLEGFSAEQKAQSPERELTDRIDQVHRQAERLSPDSTMTLYDAYQLAHEMESGELNYLFKLLIQKFIPSGERRRILTEEIVTHQDRLTGFAKRFDDRRDMKRISMQPPDAGGRDGNV